MVCRERWALGLAVLLLLAGCAKQRIVMDLHGTIMHEKPRIASVTHALADARHEGGSLVVHVTISGDPGLNASFDITPGIVERRPLEETQDGRYEGDLALSPDTVGGPFTIIGRLEHSAAGEVTQRDPSPLLITLVERRP